MTTTTFPQFAASSSARTFARYATIGARCALGFVFFSAGLMGLLNVMPPPSEPMPPGALAGALLLSNRFVPLALTLLAPVLVNIFLFHAVLTPGQVGMPSALLCVELFLAWTYRAAYRPLLTARNSASS